jgi:hypothetical protein
MVNIGVDDVSSELRARAADTEGAGEEVELKGVCVGNTGGERKRCVCAPGEVARVIGVADVGGIRGARRKL